MLNHISPRSQRGINLVELMVGIAISLVLLTGVLSVFLRITIAGGETVQAARLSQQLRGANDLISKELQRAGYVNWFAAWDTCEGDPTDGNLVDTNDDDRVDILDYYQCVSPVINDMGRVLVDGDCILYSYDINGDGAKSVGNFENFGFRLEGGAIQMRTAGNDHACDTGTWQDVTDSTLAVGELAFTLVYVADEAAGDSTQYSYVFDEDEDAWTSSAPAVSCDPSVAGDVPGEDDQLCLGRRSVQIDMTAALASDAAVTMDLLTKVKLRNDHFNTAPTP